MKNMEKEIDRLNRAVAQSQTKNLFDNAVEFGGIKLTVNSFDGMATDELRAMGDTVKDMASNVVAVFTSVNGSKGSILAVCAPDAVKLGVHAGKLVSSIAALTGGKGGGRPDSAMAGVGDVTKISDAVKQATEIVKEMLK